MSTPQERLLAVLRERSFRRGEVTLASGKKSDFFIDCKRTVMTAKGHALAGEVIFDAILEAKVEDLAALAAVPLGGCPLVGAASMVALQRGQNLDLLYIRPEAKDHGTGQRIEGAQNLDGRKTAILVEDVVTTGGSSLRAVEALKTAGLNVPFVLTLVDRLEGGRENFEAAGVNLRAIFTRNDFISPS